MPELPEVETVKRALEKKIVGRNWNDVIVVNFKKIKEEVDSALAE